MKHVNYDQIASQYEHEQFQSDAEFLIQPGAIPVLISTPHSVTHFRQGKAKFGEFMTAAIAHKLHETIGCSIITKIKNNLTDPNFDTQHPFKDAMVEFVQSNNIRLVLDLHIMSAKREAAIEIGTGKGKNVFFNTNIAQVLQNNFEQHAIAPVIVDQLFTAGNPNTVCATVASRTNIPCVQLEMNWRIVDVNNETNQIDAVVAALAEAALRLVECLD